jgi:hypothetical protein
MGFLDSKQGVFDSKHMILDSKHTWNWVWKHLNRYSNHLNFYEHAQFAQGSNLVPLIKNLVLKINIPYLE